jgi:hypothetical protein
MDQVHGTTTNMTMEEILPAHTLVGNHYSYYVAIAAALLLAYALRSSKQSCVSAPFYKASRMKWMFSADSLVRESYNKVRISTSVSYSI